jgi:hypothetical protein
VIENRLGIARVEAAQPPVHPQPTARDRDRRASQGIEDAGLEGPLRRGSNSGE